MATVGLGKSPPPTKKSPPPVEKSPPLTQKSPTLTEKSNLKKVLLRPIKAQKSPTLTEVTYNKDEKILYIFTWVFTGLGNLLRTRSSLKRLTPCRKQS